MPETHGFNLTIDEMACVIAELTASQSDQEPTSAQMAVRGLTRICSQMRQALFSAQRECDALRAETRELQREAASLRTKLVNRTLALKAVAPEFLEEPS